MEKLDIGLCLYMIFLKNGLKYLVKKNYLFPNFPNLL